MCMIAGYTGTRRAAPVLIEMLRREEGFWAGFYTGIATIDNGKLYCRKVMGDLTELLSATDAADLPGTTGIIHSRTPSGGDRKWSHPFVSCDKKIALVENGSKGCFDNRPLFAKAARELEEKGHVFSSKAPCAVTHYPVLADGCCAHDCDIQCHYIEELMHQGLSPMTALERGETDIPSEDVGVMIHTESPGTLFVARYNQPMTFARTHDESFIATSPTAFDPAAAYDAMDLLPGDSASVITAGRAQTKLFDHIPMPVQPITAKVMHDGYEAVRTLLQGAAEALPFRFISEACKAVFTGEGLAQAAPLGYAVVDAMLKAGEAELEIVRVPGMQAPLTAPSFRVKLKQ